MPATAVDLDSVYAAIGEILSDAEIELLVKQATGKDIYNEWAAPADPRKIKIKKTIEELKTVGNERWVLTYVLVYVAAEDRLRQEQEKIGKKIVKAFPKTLMGLPEADLHVAKVLQSLAVVLNTPFPPEIKIQLFPKKKDFADIVRRIVTLFAYKHLHESLLLLLFALAYSKSLLMSPAAELVPNFGSIARQVDTVVSDAPAAFALLGPAASDYSELPGQLTDLSKKLQASAADPQAAAGGVDALQRLVRLYLSRLNKQIFVSARELSFEPLLDDLPEEIEDSAEYKNLVQTIRDLTATVLARALKHKMWQDAENQMALVGSYFDCPGDAAGVARDWFTLRTRIDWLADLDPDQQWSDESRHLTGEIDNEIFKEGKLDKGVKTRFEAYHRWFAGPFRKIDDDLQRDCGSLRKMDDPLNKILNELGP